MRPLLSAVIATTLLAACAGQPPKPSTTLAAPAAPGAVAIAPATPGVVAKPAELDADAIYRSTGFKAEVHGGETLYCRDDAQTGSRILTRHTCLTATQIKQYKEDAERNADRALGTLHGSTYSSGQ